MRRERKDVTAVEAIFRMQMRNLRALNIAVHVPCTYPPVDIASLSTRAAPHLCMLHVDDYRRWVHLSVAEAPQLFMYRVFLVVVLHVLETLE